VSAAHDGPVASAATRPARRRPRPGFVLIAVVAGLLAAYDLSEAVTNLVFVPQDVRYQNNEFFSEVGVGSLAASPPWAALWANVLLPPVAYAAALLVARRRPLGQVALAFATGLAAVAAVSLSLTAYVLSI
jgi:hypothetical protein